MGKSKSTFPKHTPSIYPGPTGPIHLLAQTVGAGQWKVMGPDLLTISTLAHQKDIEPARRHYDYLDTGRIPCQVDEGLPPWTSQLARELSKSKATHFSRPKEAPHDDDVKCDPHNQQYYPPCRGLLGVR